MEQTRSISAYFDPAKSMSKVSTSTSRSANASPPPPAPTECQQLRDDKYIEYILRTQTRSNGGVSSRKRGQLIREMFPYKPFGPQVQKKKPVVGMSQSGDSDESEAGGCTTVVVKSEVPKDGNKNVPMAEWTDAEIVKHDEKMRAWARWEVDRGLRVVRSTTCQRTTANEDSICDACAAVAKDESFKADVRKVCSLQY